jgi:hypothetical protein
VLVEAAAAETTTDQIGSAATLMSISLGVLSAFANQRARTVGAQKANLEGLTTTGVVWDLLLDLALGLFGVLLLAAGAPLFDEAADRATPLLHADTAFFALFCLLYIGVAVVVAWVISTVWRRCEVLGEI